MALDVIGPGFGRTGTASLKRALEILGIGPCHHMEDCFANPAQVPHWQAVAAGRTVDRDVVFEGYRAQVDWPGAHVWRELATAYPYAKVVLSTRSEEAWWNSFSATIGQLISHPDQVELPPHVAAMLAAGTEMIQAQTFGAPVTDRAAGLAAFRRREAEVRAAIAPDHLLVFNVAEGWGPLCAFLGVGVPDVPFPRINNTEEFWKLVRGEPI